ncbi:MAG TPA: adenosylcobalamin-dependent ribonucleoside-diphosphate reductase [Xanthobacteraceae bacterium]|nr:adenosylcobalamin-dependent ribonucleoside-diphosphate reductase [Xanthobacteraceae bacterium]
MNELAADISRHIWETKYRYTDGVEPEPSMTATWRRIARALAAVETNEQAVWEERFFDILHNFKFLPGGRIQAGAGTSRQVTLFNCFVMGTIEDSMPDIFRALQESAITMQQGGGIGIDFSTLRPRGARAKAAGNIASGPVSFMHIWDAMCGTVLSTGARRGAMMATLRCDHPDIEEFVAAKRQPGQLRRFNLSVLATDAFITAVRNDSEWPLVFPSHAFDAEGEVVQREWSGTAGPVSCRILRRMPARRLWEQILRAAYDYAEPGILFIDRINQANNLRYRERISATNPCGEIPLPPYGACNLGSLNLTSFVLSPFTPEARIDNDRLADTAMCAVRMLDNVIDASRFPLPQQAEMARGTRRIGLGITGLADALVMLGLRYGSERSLKVAADIMRLICHSAYRASIAIAREKGSFPHFQPEPYLQSAFIRRLPDDIRSGIARHGIRNSHLTAIAPTGTISLLAGNVSSGLEPIYEASYTRRVLAEDGTQKEFTLTDYAISLWRSLTGATAGRPSQFVTATELPPRAHLEMQAALQPFVDNSISKTINVPANYPFDEFKQIYDTAYDLHLKGCTTFRPNPVTGAVLSEDKAELQAPHCCVPEREAD